MPFSLDVQKKIVYDNLHMQEKAFATQAEARRSHLADLARVLLQSLPQGKVSVDSLASLVEAAPLLSTEDMLLHKEALEENRPYLSRVLRGLSYADRVTLAHSLADLLEAEGRGMTMTDFIRSEARQGRVAYVRNSFTDEAYDIFCPMLTDPTVSPCDDYDSACAAVRNGEADFCILPFRDEHKTRVRGAYSLMQGYDLIVCGVATVDDGEGVEREYALCGRVRLPIEGAYTLLLAFEDMPLSELGQFCDSSALCRLELKDVLCQRGRLSVALEGNESPIPYFIWLTLFAPAHRVDGVYPIS